MHGVLIMRLVLVLLGLLLAGPASAQFNVGGAVSTATGTNRILCSIRAANMNTTTDQACTIPSAVKSWNPTSLEVTNCSGTLTLAVGGVYPATSKGGTALVANTQIYSSLSAASIVLLATLAANIATTRFTINTVYFSLTTAAGGAATCDFYVIGNDLS